MNLCKFSIRHLGRTALFFATLECSIQTYVLNKLHENNLPSLFIQTEMRGEKRRTPFLQHRILTNPVFLFLIFNYIYDISCGYKSRMQFQYAESNVNIVIPKGILQLLCTGQRLCEMQNLKL